MHRRFLPMVRFVAILMATIVGLSLTWNVYQRVKNYPAGPFFGHDCHSREDHFTLKRYDPAQMINDMVSGALVNIDFCAPSALPLRDVEFRAKAYQSGGNDHSVIDWSITTDDTTVHYYVDKSSGLPVVRSVKMSPFLAASLLNLLPFANDPSRRDGELVRQTSEIDISDMESRWAELTSVMTEFFSVRVDPIPGSLYTAEEVNALHKGLAPWLFCLVTAKINYEAFEKIRQIPGVTRTEDDDAIFHHKRERVVQLLSQMEHGWVDVWHELAIPAEFDRLVNEYNKRELGWLGCQMMAILALICLAIFPKIMLIPYYLYSMWLVKQARLADERAFLAKEQAEREAQDLARAEVRRKKREARRPDNSSPVASRPLVIDLGSRKPDIAIETGRDVRERITGELMAIAASAGVSRVMDALLLKITARRDLELFLNILQKAQGHTGGVAKIVNFLREVKVPRDHICPESTTFRQVDDGTFFSSRDEESVAIEA